MEQAQVFASAWPLVGGRFDGGNAMDDAEVAKAELRQMIEKALAKPEQEHVAWPCVIVEADFEKNTITLEMCCEDYKVAAGTHWLSVRPMLTNDYLQGHKDGCEWSAQMSEATHPQTGDWLYDDPRDLAKALRNGPVFAQPKASQEPVAWGFQNTAITGSNRWMMLREEVPANDQYGGALWTPLYTHPQPQPQPKAEPVAYKQFLSDVHTAAGLVTHGKQCKALGERLSEGVMRYMATPPSAQPKAEQEPKREPCVWTQSEDPHMPDTWESACGAVWTFTEGGPKDNDMNHCPKCGKPAVEAAHGIKGE